MFIIFPQDQVEKKKLTLVITDMITLQCHRRKINKQARQHKNTHTKKQKKHK